MRGSLPRLAVMALTAELASCVSRAGSVLTRSHSRLRLFFLDLLA